jgi:DNA-binding CsgD family transcriptional regulator
MVSLEAFSELLEVLYSVPLQQEEWEHFLALLSKHTGSEFGVLLCANSRSALSIRALGGGDKPFDQTAYNEQYAPSDPFRESVVRNGYVGVFEDEELLPGDGLLETDMYRQLLEPAGLRYTTLLVLTVTIRRLEAITLARTPHQGRISEDCSRLLNLLLPHIRKALEIRHVLGVAQQRLAGAEAMVDASATATLLLNRQGRVLHRNAAAERLLQQSDALTLRDGVLSATGAHSRESLGRLFHDAALPVSPNWQSTPARALSLERPGRRQPLQLLASPLPPASRVRSNAELVLLVTDPEEPVNYPDDVLRALYGLTPAQTDVANGLLTGYTLEEIACLRKVSIGTVRQQLKSILSKTGASRQSDLVRLLMTLPPAARAK